MSDPFEQIGAKLKAAREAAGLEIGEAAAQAQIPRSAAESLEAEDFSNFPSPVYAKSFLAKYSEFLGVDAKQWLDALEPGSFMPSGQVGALLKGPEQEPKREEKAPEQRGGMLSVILLLALTALIVLGAIKGYEYFADTFEEDSNQPEEIQTPVDRPEDDPVTEEP